MFRTGFYIFFMTIEEQRLLLVAAIIYNVVCTRVCACVSSLYKDFSLLLFIYGHGHTTTIEAVQMDFYGQHHVHLSLPSLLEIISSMTFWV